MNEKTTQDSKWKTIPTKEIIERTIVSLKKNGMDAIFVEKDEAKQKVLELIPKGAEIMTMTSVTLDALGIKEAIDNSEEYDAVRKKLATMNKATQSREMQKLGAAPDWAIGSVHAITENGQVVVASNTGSQLPAYVYASNHVIWVVGAQKIVENLDEAMKRLYEYTLPLESERAKKAYNVPGSNVSKMLVVSKEINAGRITVVIVNDVLGY